MAFFRIGVIADLEELRERKIMKLADVIQAMVRLKIAAKRESLDRDRMDAVSNLQKNARLSIKLLRWNWWHLFLKVQPLLDVKHAENNKKRMQEQWSSTGMLLRKPVGNYLKRKRRICVFKCQ